MCTSDIQKERLNNRLCWWGLCQGNNNLNHRQKEAPSRPSTNGVRCTETVSSAGWCVHSSHSALQAWCMLREEANVCTSLAARLRDWMRPSPGLLNHSKQLGSPTTTVHVRSLLFSSMWLAAPVEPVEPSPCRRPRSAVWRTAGAALTGGQGGAAAWRLCRRSALSARSPVHPGWPWLKGAWRSSPHPAHSARCCLCRHLLRSSSFNKLRGTDGTVTEWNNWRK